MTYLASYILSLSYDPSATYVFISSRLSTWVLAAKTITPKSCSPDAVGAELTHTIGLSEQVREGGQVVTAQKRVLFK